MTPSPRCARWEEQRQRWQSESAAHFIVWFLIPIGFVFRQELQSGVVELLIHTPNSFADVGSNTDRCTFFSSSLHLKLTC